MNGWRESLGPDFPVVEGPATYRILVQGFLDPATSRRLSGMSIESTVDDHGRTITCLEGELADQAALAGVLNAIYSYLLPVLSVECLTGEGQE